MATSKAFFLYHETSLFPGPKTSEIFARSVLAFQRACRAYKLILDENHGGRFCIDGHCKTIFMVEVTFDGKRWGATPKMFDSEAAAQNEAEELILKYPFLSGCRVITRRIEEDR